MTTQRTETNLLPIAPDVPQESTSARPSFTQDDLARIAGELEPRSPQEILGWALEAFKEHITLACSFGGPTGMVLLDMVMRLDASVPVFYLDTGFLFPETYALVETVAHRYGVTPRAVRPAITPEGQVMRYGDALWERDPDRCCHVRKVMPQREALRGFDAWITGLRRDQAQTRRAVPVVAWDSKFELVKFAPLATWTERDVWRYISDFDIPVNELHAQGYPSLGCTHCTRPIAEGEDLRAGRWSGIGKTECGLHTPSSPDTQGRG